MHELQAIFATDDRETGWAQDMHALFGAGAFDHAEALLAEALTALDSELAWLCLELPRERVALSGWEGLGEAIARHRGEPITAVTIAIADEPDRNLGKGAISRPQVRLGLYSDHAYGFSQAERWQLLEECHSSEPDWAGRAEDVDVRLAIKGLDILNTRLAHHKERDFLHGAPRAQAPLRYVEFVLGCWWRALRWHQAVATQCADRALPRAIPVIASMMGMRPGAVAIHDPRHKSTWPSLALVREEVASLMAERFGGALTQSGVAEGKPLRRLLSDQRHRAPGSAGVRPGQGEGSRTGGMWARVFGRS